MLAVFYSKFVVTIATLHALIRDFPIAMFLRSHYSYIQSPRTGITKTIIDMPKQKIQYGTMEMELFSVGMKMQADKKSSVSAIRTCG
jgi:uncharacterized protein YerC